jgi:Cu+-exporting ATPase
MLIEQEEVIEKESTIQCFHCGDDCGKDHIVENDKHFCCQGCHSVYHLLDSKDLCTYYDLTQFPGKKNKVKLASTYLFLDTPEIAQQLILFSDHDFTQISFYVPAIHCTSCVWLLENLQKIQPGVIQSRVDFIKKKVIIDYNNQQTSPRDLAEILEVLGYSPYISAMKNETDAALGEKRKLLYKIGVAGFCAGNIMLLSFPEYLGLNTAEESMFKPFLGYLNLALALPVVFYAASEYFIGAYQGLKNKVLTLDVPIVIGTLAVFFRSVFEVLTHTGGGYFDSLTGLILFLVVGKWFQKVTYQALAFDKDYLSYFPIAITKIFDSGKEAYVMLNSFSIGDTILVRSNEIVPADGYLLENGKLDYSFVTGESIPISKLKGDLVYAGAKNIGTVLKLKL